ncbi:MAG: hypothetical protein A3B38_00335 [Candidatus Levybacteria bacterium RIFCSPLOWO2_01_FULL_36_13]|nr:MAG: hypothetical protein A3B38_00335 [Candidatus Levybacteria bacterium RIFCSPLOWO2_01_FULL_36_13]
MSSNLAYVDKIVETEIKDFADKFLKDYCNGKASKKANILNKKNNIFIAALGDEITVYSALMRSLDSSLGNRLEKIAKLIANENYEVRNEVKGYISEDSIRAIASLLESYKNRSKRPKEKDLELIYREVDSSKKLKRHASDYYLTLRSDPSQKFLVELKIGGDLDNKKARSEKEALLEQYVILRNSDEIKPSDTVKIFFCTAYNKYGEDAKWTQERVRQFFCDSEIKVGRDFWNFFCNSPEGYEAVKSSYLKHAHFLKDALKEIVEHFASP